MQAGIVNLFEDQALNNGQRTACKFVLVRRDEQVLMVFGPKQEFPYHANLVERFCHLNDIPSGWQRKPDHYEIFDGDCEILGGGYLDFDPAARQVSVWGASTAYGRFPVRELGLVVESEPIFDGFVVTIQ